MQRFSRFCLLAITLSIFAACGRPTGTYSGFKKYQAPREARDNVQIKIEQDLSQPALPPAEQQLQKIIVSKKTKVGILLPLSGKNKEIGQSLLNSILLSFFDHNPTNIELVIFDTKGTEIGAGKAIREVAKKDIKLVIGPLFSTSLQAISSVVEANNITVLSFSNNANLANHSGVFLMGFLPEQQVEKIVDYAINQEKTNFAIIAPNNQYGLIIANLLKDVTRRKDANFITSEFYLSERDAAGAVRRALSAYKVADRVYENLPAGSTAKDRARVVVSDKDKLYADVIMIPESGKILTRVAEEIKNTNKKNDVQIIGSSQWDDISTLNDENLLGGWFPAPNPENFRKFEKQYYQTYGIFPLRISSIGYDAMSVVSELVAQDPKKRLTADDFINYKSSKNGFEGIDGLFRFLPNGLVQRNFAVLEVNDGSFTVIDNPFSVFFRY